MDAKTARIMVWENLRKVARADSRYGWDFNEFIPDYIGSEAGADLLIETDIYKNSEVIFVTPDANLERFREYIIRDKKTLLMTSHGIRRGIFVIRPGDVPEGKEDLASVLDGAHRYWHPITLAQIKEQIGHIDMLITGASAITYSGIRFGKGHGYFDLEWAMFWEIGVVDQDTPVFGAGHDCQVVDIELEVAPHDTAIDYIVTPTQIIKTRGEYPKPTHGVIWSMLAESMMREIPPVHELWDKIACR